MKKSVSFGENGSSMQSPQCISQDQQVATRAAQSALDYAASQRASEAAMPAYNNRPNVIPRPLPPAASQPEPQVKNAPASSASNHMNSEATGSGGWTSVVNVVGGMVGKLFTGEADSPESNYVYDEKLGTWVCPSDGQVDLSGPAPPPPGCASPSKHAPAPEGGITPISNRYVDTFHKS